MDDSTAPRFRPRPLLLPISPLASLRMGLAALGLKTMRDWRPLESVRPPTTGCNVTWAGKPTAACGSPCSSANSATSYREVNMAWLWARIVSRSLRLGTFEGGFQAFLDALAGDCRRHGAGIRFNTPVTRVTRPGGRLSIHLENGSEHRFDRVLSTTSPRLMLRLCERTGRQRPTAGNSRPCAALAGSASCWRSNAPC